MNRKQIDLGSGNVRKLLFSLSLPTILSQIVNMLYNLVDRVFIGHIQPVETVGKLALTGVGVCFPVIIIISAFAALLALIFGEGSIRAIGIGTLIIAVTVGFMVKLFKKILERPLTKILTK